MASLPGNPHAAASVSADAHIGETIIAPEGQTDATLIASVIQANTAATLALAHEQRTALLVDLIRAYADLGRADQVVHLIDDILDRISNT